MAEGTGALTTRLPTTMVGGTKNPLSGCFNLGSSCKFATLVFQIATVVVDLSGTTGDHSGTDNPRLQGTLALARSEIVPPNQLSFLSTLL